MAVSPAPVRVPSQRPLAPSVALVTLVTNDKDNNEMILGAVHRSPGARQERRIQELRLVVRSSRPTVLTQKKVLRVSVLYLFTFGRDAEFCLSNR